MSASFSAQVEQYEDLTHIALSGKLSEESLLVELSSHLVNEDVMINLSKVRSINNSGLRNWLRWIADVDQQHRIVLYGLSPEVIAQLNMVSNFSGASYIFSLYAPYYCSDCDLENHVLLDTRALDRQQLRAPQYRCDACANRLSFDDIEDHYFSFLHRIPVTIPDDLLAKVDELSASIPKQVSGDDSSLHSQSSVAENTMTLTSTDLAGKNLPTATALRRLRAKTDIVRAVRTKKDGGIKSVGDVWRFSFSWRWIISLVAVSIVCVAALAWLLIR